MSLLLCALSRPVLAAVEVALEIDPCVGVSQPAVSRRLELELGEHVSSGAATSPETSRATVTCQKDGQISLRIDDPLTKKWIFRSVDLKSQNVAVRERVLAVALAELFYASFAELLLEKQSGPPKQWPQGAATWTGHVENKLKRPRLSVRPCVRSDSKPPAKSAARESGDPLPQVAAAEKTEPFSPEGSCENASVPTATASEPSHEETVDERAVPSSEPLVQPKTVDEARLDPRPQRPLRENSNNRGSSAYGSRDGLVLSIAATAGLLVQRDAPSLLAGAGLRFIGDTARHVGWEVDLQYLGSSVNVPLGSIRSNLFGTRLAVHGHVKLMHLQLRGGGGLRLGFVHHEGQPIPGGQVAGLGQWGPWLSPLLLGSVSALLGRRLRLDVVIEGSYVIIPVSARSDGQFGAAHKGPQLLVSVGFGSQLR